MKNSNDWDNRVREAFKSWKRKDYKAWNKFRMWTSRQLDTQKNIDEIECISYDDENPFPEIEERVEDFEKCDLWKSYFVNRMCDICHLDNCPHYKGA